MRFGVSVLTCLVAVAICGSSWSAAHAAKIEADPNKSYELTKTRGPWMVMVATFHTTDTEGASDEGKTPAQAAHDLVIELRKLGMPAYVYEHEPPQERITSVDQFGREEYKKNLRRIKSTCVLAGNYRDIHDKLAQDSLAWIKKLKPKSLSEGVHFEPTPGRPSVLSGAFLTTNPMLTANEVQRLQEQSVDPLLIQMNNGERNSLFENRGEYTLVVARFYGKYVTVKENEVESAIKSYFNYSETGDNSDKVSLDKAIVASRELVTVLRGSYDKEESQLNNIDAYIWHDHNESIVTVGSFSSPDDPAINAYLKRFGPAMRPTGGGMNYQPAHLGVSGFGPNRDQSRLWLFEPTPVVMKVPRHKR
ncbi:MAG TPA: hypothetical protein VNQ76_10015 [Planctomicrobium sp.]|nr:hypothetical protein [Planctomicrobium sp.]